jgi:hypothetical protein
MRMSFGCEDGCSVDGWDRRVDGRVVGMSCDVEEK